MHVLLAVDGSEHSLAAAAMLGDLCLPPDSQIDAVAVLLPREGSYAGLAQSALEAARSRLSGSSARINLEVVVGYPTEALAGVAIDRRPDLVVMGAKGLRATLGVLLGGVAQQVVEYVDSPVLVVRAPYKGLRKVLVVTDGSPTSEATIQFMIHCLCPGRQLKETRQVEVMHVCPPPPSASLLAHTWAVDPVLTARYPIDDAAALSQQEAESDLKHGRAILEATKAEMAEAGVSVHTLLRVGDAATEILDYAHQTGADLICAGSRGLSMMRGFLLGSVSRKLVHYANCSVLLVKNVQEEKPWANTEGRETLHSDTNAPSPV
jgi:nucleotide-binding universal stress UspA family protein